MEWLRKLLEGATITDGKLDVDSLMGTVNAEFPKHAVPKDTFNNTNEQLKTANKTIADLKKGNKDNEELQQTIKNHEKKISEQENELAQIKKQTHLKDEFRKAGAKENYLELLMQTSKLDDIAEVNGQYVGADKIINASKETYKDLFTTTEPGSDAKKDNTYHYEPKDGNPGESSANFLDIITENQVKR